MYSILNTLQLGAIKNGSVVRFTTPTSKHKIHTLRTIKLNSVSSEIQTKWGERNCPSLEMAAVELNHSIDSRVLKPLDHRSLASEYV